MNVAATGITRRSFLQRTGAAAMGLTAVGGEVLLAETASPDIALRVAFATDLHLMVNGARGSAEGIAQCLDAIEALRPRPDFILCGGDLTHESPDLDFKEAEELLDQFLVVWQKHTNIPSHFTFGNHDLVGAKSLSANHDDGRFGKGLFQRRLGLGQTYYSFDAGDWHFVILDDVILKTDGSYVGEFPREQLTFLRDDLTKNRTRPTVICGHIPSVSVFPIYAGLAHVVGSHIEVAAAEIATNTPALLEVVTQTKANVRLVLAGHLHHLERIDLDGICFLNGGAVCGNFWKGPKMGCSEGFSLLDLQSDGSFVAKYQSIGWTAQGRPS